MAAMTSYLATRTAQLPMVELSEPASAIGTTTTEAILSADLHGAALGPRDSADPDLDADTGGGGGGGGGSVGGGSGRRCRTGGRCRWCIGTS
jgi:hypothetical protein